MKKLIAFGLIAFSVCLAQSSFAKDHPPKDVIVKSFESCDAIVAEVIPVIVVANVTAVLPVQEAVITQKPIFDISTAVFSVGERRRINNLTVNKIDKEFDSLLQIALPPAWA